MAGDDPGRPAGLDDEYRHLRQGSRYRVVRAFVDYDWITHPIGEVWVFEGSHFVPYHDGLSLFVVIDGRSRQVRLQASAAEQAHIIDAFDKYLVPCDGRG
ncbi:DUF3601 domain-containing protein [Salinisphaera sp. Q1T1-3]|uniref:DUF3601 domain-containing protein n=1 Tax=Salinisphaera sp. Q1T1-3 TaxID=2321229 RepID=UPI0013143923|nr:DUF3601 domain-containing protein [Salinisphaera sp. Q1T1-3]